jgi:hypothetical protein
MQSVLLVEETGENHWHATSHWQTWSHTCNVVSSTLCLSGIRSFTFDNSKLFRDPSSLNNKSYLNQTYMQHGCGKTMLKENAFENQLKWNVAEQCCCSVSHSPCDVYRE